MQGCKVHRLEYHHRSDPSRLLTSSHAFGRQRGLTESSGMWYGSPVRDTAMLYVGLTAAGPQHLYIWSKHFDNLYHCHVAANSYSTCMITLLKLPFTHGSIEIIGNKVPCSWIKHTAQVGFKSTIFRLWDTHPNYSAIIMAGKNVRFPRNMIKFPT